jgi:hypothetical protein
VEGEKQMMMEEGAKSAAEEDKQVVKESRLKVDIATLDKTRK